MSGIVKNRLPHFTTSSFISDTKGNVTNKYALPIYTMGAGILPATIRNGKLWLLFGKENQFEKSAPGFSDFGGGNEAGESPLDTAAREGGEELTGFLGTGAQIKQMLKTAGTYVVNHSDTKYTTHIFPMKYDPYLEKYYNNNQQFIQAHLDPVVIQSSKIFEKAEIRWICVDDLKKMRPNFRHFYVNIIDQIIENQKDITAFVRGKSKGTRKHRN